MERDELEREIPANEYYDKMMSITADNILSAKEQKLFRVVAAVTPDYIDDALWNGAKTDDEKRRVLQAERIKEDNENKVFREWMIGILPEMIGSLLNRYKDKRKVIAELRSLSEFFQEHKMTCDVNEVFKQLTNTHNERQRNEDDDRKRD